VTPEAIDRLADEFFAAIERGDLEAVAGYYADDVVVWHNVTRRDQTREENLRLLRHLSGRIADWRYEEVRRDCFPGGFVQRHLLRGTNAAGEEVELPVCLVAGVRGGRIARIEEYLDGEAARPLFAGEDARLT
jgi:ketosteroid isomerase-like protein